MPQRFQFTVSEENSGKRLDQIMASEVRELSRTRSKRVLAEGGVFVDKKRVKVAGRVLYAGQKVVIHYNAQLLDRTGLPPFVPLELLDCNDDLLIVNKPSGVFSAPTPESDQNDLVYLLGRQLREQGLHDELFVIHRLDRPTSGLMVFARSKKAAAELSQGMESHAIDRQYLALVIAPTSDSISVREPIDGRAACTHMAVLERRGPVALVCARLETGRTHQVRIHAEHWGSPILGDSKYGRRAIREHMRASGSTWELPPRLALHAHQLQIPLAGGSIKTYSSELPPDLSAYWDALPRV